MELSKTDSSFIFPLLKIKNFFQSNEKIGKISKFIPPMINKTFEIYIVDILSEIIALNEKKKKKKIKVKHFKYLTKKYVRFRNFS